MSEEVNNFLAHFGIKGMKWGIRKDQKSSEGPTLSPQKAALFKSIHQELKRDLDPTNLDKPANPGDTFSGDGFTGAADVNYAKYFSKNAYYYKFENGEKMFTSMSDDVDDPWMYMNPKGDLISAPEMKAYNGTLKHSTKDKEVKNGSG